jgi:23S rRNA (cytosine1962-C5)-methyltransferase
MANTKVQSALAASGDQAGSAPRGRLRLRVRSTAESIVRSGHPWLFAESIREQNRPGRMGELAVIYDRADQFLALGLFDPTSAIRVRVLHVGKARVVNKVFWKEKLSRALQKRSGLFGPDTTGFRWINGESDGFPGLVLDRYGVTLVLKLYTAAWLPWLDEVGQVIAAELQPERIVLRLSRNAQESAGKQFGRTEGEVLCGPALNQPVTFLESGLRFEADVLRGQKTGFFLDQRENRRKVEGLARDRAVLNAFSFSGGFSLYAARGGARSVLEVDISAHALAAAERNFSLNASHPNVQSCEVSRFRADAFEWLAANRNRKFDLIILDPPSLAKKESERSGALLAYARLASLGMLHLSPGGILVACSCSAHVSEEEFFQAVLSSAEKSRRNVSEICRTGQPPDHPAAFPEAKYLKTVYIKGGKEGL